MWYLVEEYRWDIENNIKYYHLTDSKIVRTTTIKDGEHKEENDDKGNENDNNDNKNNENKEVTMQDLKESIDKLTKMVEGLQADLHVAQESLTQKDEEIKTLTEKLNNIQIPEVKYGRIQSEI